MAAEHVRPLLAQLADVPANEWKHAERCLRLEALARGDALTAAGNLADRFGFVVDGLIKKLHVTARGQPIVRGFGGPGSIVGAYASLLTREPSYLRVEAIAPTRLFVMAWSDWLALCERHGCWQIIARRMAETTFLEREARAHELLTLNAAERFARFQTTHRELMPALKAHEIASYLGITPVSLSRLRARERQKQREHRAKG
jgi:CRP-like cAMP-binding protein